MQRLADTVDLMRDGETELGYTDDDAMTTADENIEPGQRHCTSTSITTQKLVYGKRLRHDYCRGATLKLRTNITARLRTNFHISRRGNEAGPTSSSAALPYSRNLFFASSHTQQRSGMGDAVQSKFQQEEEALTARHMHLSNSLWRILSTGILASTPPKSLRRNLTALDFSGIPLQGLHSVWAATACSLRPLRALTLLDLSHTSLRPEDLTTVPCNVPNLTALNIASTIAMTGAGPSVRPSVRSFICLCVHVCMCPVRAYLLAGWVDQ